MVVSTRYMRAGPGHHPDGQQVVGRAGHHIAGRVSVVEFGRHPLQMSVELVPQVGLDAAAAAVEQLAHAVAGDAADQRDGEQQPDGALDRRGTPRAGPEGVDALLDELGARGSAKKLDTTTSASRAA